ncbi:minor capsid protein [Bacillus paranthracis]|uniref:putative minor capsid protein n=1 Tax=Bacillus cereus group TaxID=86661 RepID=UPI001F5942C0|nr:MULTISPECIES: putative minor capsid protein [Bacillus cereus group]MCU5020542.1 minor capsid protein [Bacillus paranthracis]
MASPIRRDLLIHTVTHQAYSPESSGWGGDESSYGTPTTVELVRVEPYSELKRDSLGDSIVEKLILFWDAFHSTKVVFNEKDKITFNGTEYEVSSVATLYDNRTVHHLEVILK